MPFINPDTLSSEELGESCLEAYTLLQRLKEAERLYVEACGERDALAMHPPTAGTPPVCLECGMTYLCPRCVDAAASLPLTPGDRE